MTSENIHLEFTELNCDADHVANELNFLSDFYADYYESDNDDEGEKEALFLNFKRDSVKRAKFEHRVKIEQADELLSMPT